MDSVFISVYKDVHSMEVALWCNHRRTQLPLVNCVRAHSGQESIV